MLVSSHMMMKTSTLKQTTRLACFGPFGHPAKIIKLENCRTIVKSRYCDFLKYRFLTSLFVDYPLKCI